MAQPEINAALQSQLTELTAMQDMLLCMVRALIETHPDHRALGSSFDGHAERLLALYTPTKVSEDTLAALHAARQAVCESLRRTLR